MSIPREGSSLLTGTNVFGGTAWAQHTGIAKVEYQLDGSAWQGAEIGTASGTDTWVQWRAGAHLDAGRHELRVRATDMSGYTQTAAYADSVPDGATGWDRVRFEAT